MLQTSVELKHQVKFIHLLINLKALSWPVLLWICSLSWEHWKVCYSMYHAHALIHTKPFTGVLCGWGRKQRTCRTLTQSWEDDISKQSLKLRIKPIIESLSIMHISITEYCVLKRVLKFAP